MIQDVRTGGTRRVELLGECADGDRVKQAMETWRDAPPDGGRDWIRLRAHEVVSGTGPGDAEPGGAEGAAGQYA